MNEYMTEFDSTVLVPVVGTNGIFHRDGRDGITTHAVQVTPLNWHLLYLVVGELMAAAKGEYAVVFDGVVFFRSTIGGEALEGILMEIFLSDTSGTRGAGGR